MADSVLRKYAKSAATDAETKPVPLEDKALAPAADALTETTVIMLDIVLRSGNHVALSYAYMTKVEFDPSSSIVIHVMEDRVTVTGRNLRSVYQALITHRLRLIRESAEDFTGGDIEVFIERIEIGPETK